jgi:hypothetical protein
MCVADEQLYVVRGRYCQPDGIGWLMPNGGVTDDRRRAQTYKSEADAWLHLTIIDHYWLGDENGPYYWIELEEKSQ